MKNILRLCCSLLLLFTYGAWAGCALISGSTVQATDTLNLSDLLTSQDTHSETRAATWQAPVNCYVFILKSNNVHYISPLAQGYWIRFTDSAGSDRWIKLQTSDYTSMETYKNGRVVLNGADYSYVLTATLLNGDPGVTDTNYYTIASGGIATIVPMVIHNANLVGLTGQVPTMDEVARVVASGNWNNDYLGYQSLTVTFNPAQTTCHMPDQTVMLPRVSLNLLGQGFEDGSTAFTLPVSCANTLAGGATRPVNAWLSSADLVNGNQYIMRNGVSGSSGVGIALTTDSGSPVMLADPGNAARATSLLTLARGDVITDTAIEMHASYKIFDAASLSPGSVIATATLWFDYD